MISKATPAFWRYFDDLPLEVRELAEKAYAMWKADSHNASLNFERLGKNLWSVRVGIHYRVLGRKSIDLDSGEEVFIWHWIGNHDAYDRLKRRG